MKSRDLKTIPVLIVTNYTTKPNSSEDFLHSFTPHNARTVYQFFSEQNTPLLEEGKAYNIAYTEVGGANLVSIKDCAKADLVVPSESHRVARRFGEERRTEETKKSNNRVTHSATDGAYLGRKYAWRIYGMAVAREIFDAYLAEIKHPYVNCITKGTSSIAYLDEGIDKAMEALIESCVRVEDEGNRFKSDLLPGKDWFTVKGIEAITDKK